MNFIKATQNLNLKLNCAGFTHVVKHVADPNHYRVGSIVDVFFKTKNGSVTFEGDNNKYTCIGKAEIVGKRIVKFKDINDSIAVLECGHKAPYLQAILKRRYPTAFAITGIETEFEYLCLMYVKTFEISPEDLAQDESYSHVVPPHKLINDGNKAA